MFIDDTWKMENINNLESSETSYPIFITGFKHYVPDSEHETVKW